MPAPSRLVLPPHDHSAFHRHCRGRRVCSRLVEIQLRGQPWRHCGAVAGPGDAGARCRGDDVADPLHNGSGRYPGLSARGRLAGLLDHDPGRSGRYPYRLGTIGARIGISGRAGRRRHQPDLRARCLAAASEKTRRPAAIPHLGAFLGRHCWLYQLHQPHRWAALPDLHGAVAAEPGDFRRHHRGVLCQRQLRQAGPVLFPRSVVGRQSRAVGGAYPRRAVRHAGRRLSGAARQREILLPVRLCADLLAGPRSDL